MNSIDKLPIIKEIAKSRGGKCLSDVYVNNASLLLFECNVGHQWTTTWKSIKYAWCPECAKIKSRGKNNSRFDSIENMQKIANERGGKCLSIEYFGAHVKLNWKCNFDHEWMAKPNTIKNGAWCPQCCDGIGERVCRLIFETLFKAHFPKVRPDWLRNPISSRNLELDGFCEQLSIAFEYNGHQHYQESNIFTRSQYDAFKIEQCQLHNINLFIIKEIPIISKYQLILDEITQQAQLYQIDIDMSIPIDINQVYQSNSSQQFLLKLKNIAKQNGGECLSSVYIDNRFKLDFQCGACQYVWKTSPNSIKNGHWCINCADKIKSIEDAKLLASNKNGQCLSNIYTNSIDKMKWQCYLGHQWDASYNQIQSGGWCPICFENNRGQSKRLKIEAYQQAALKKGGRCLSIEVNSCYDKLEFECACNHRWFARADMIKNTKQWCPECAMEKRIADLKRIKNNSI